MSQFKKFNAIFILKIYSVDKSIHKSASVYLWAFT